MTDQTKDPTPPVGRVIRDDTFPLRAMFLIGFIAGFLAGLVLMMVRQS